MKRLRKKVSIWREVSDLPGASHYPPATDSYTQTASCCGPWGPGTRGRQTQGWTLHHHLHAWQMLSSQNRDLAENFGSTHITLTDDLTLEIIFDGMFLAHGVIIC